MDILSYCQINEVRLENTFRRNLLLADRGLDAFLAEEVETVLDDGRVIHWAHADRTLKVLKDRFDVWDQSLQKHVGNLTRFLPDLGHDEVVELLVALIHDVN